MTENMISPKHLYEHPERFGGIMRIGKKSGHPEYAINVFIFMKNVYPDFPKKLAEEMKDYIIMTNNKPAIFFGDNVVELMEIPDYIYEDIKEFLFF